MVRSTWNTKTCILISSVGDSRYLVTWVGGRGVPESSWRDILLSSVNGFSLLEWEGCRPLDVTVRCLFLLAVLLVLLLLAELLWLLLLAELLLWLLLADVSQLVSARLSSPDMISSPGSVSQPGAGDTREGARAAVTVTGTTGSRPELVRVKLWQVRGKSSG